MKYRMIFGKNDRKPFIVQRRNEKSLFSFWSEIDCYPTERDAKRMMSYFMERHTQYTIGDVISEYTERDVIIDKLKNTTIKNNYAEGDYAQDANKSSATSGP